MSRPATAGRPLSHQRRYTIAERWEYWIPRAITYARANFPLDPAAEFERLRQRHMERSTAAILTGLPWSTIKASLLDDPLADVREIEQRVREALARREARMGRVKGRTKSTRRTR